MYNNIDKTAGQRVRIRIRSQLNCIQDVQICKLGFCKWYAIVRDKRIDVQHKTLAYILIKQEKKYFEFICIFEIKLTAI